LKNKGIDLKIKIALNFYADTKDATIFETLKSNFFSGKMGGNELFYKVKELNGNFIFFIFLSAKVEKDEIRFVMNLDADDYLTKAKSSIDLIHAVEARLSLRTKFLKEIYKRIENSMHEDRVISHEDAESIIGNLSKSVLRVLYHVAQEKATQEIADKIFLRQKKSETYDTILVKSQI
jgi:DNA-binding NarL/FixJ family response regulator